MFAETLGESQLNDELAFAYAKAFESASDVVNARMSESMTHVSAGSTLRVSTAVAVGRDARQTIDITARRVYHFLQAMIILFQEPLTVIMALLRLVNFKMVGILFLAQVGCKVNNLWGQTKLSVETVLNELTTLNQFQITQPIAVIRKLAKLFDSMQKAASYSAPPPQVVYRDDRLGPYLLAWLTKLGGTYFITQNGWYILKQLSFAFVDKTKRITVKKEAIRAVVSGLSTPLSLDELLDSTEEAVAELTGNEKIMKKKG